MAESAGTDTRDKILIATATMLGEDPSARLSVRAVAAREGVSTGLLRHFFPTQRALLETVVAGLYDLDIPDDPIHETGRTPTERILGCLHQMPAQVGTGDWARQHWRGMYESYVAPTPTEDQAATYLALERVGLHLIERWLTVLIDEGAIPATDVSGGPGSSPPSWTDWSPDAPFRDTVRLRFETDTLLLAVEVVMPHSAGDSPVRAPDRGLDR